MTDGDTASGRDAPVGIFGVNTPTNVDDLTLVRERKQKPVNEFLEQRHPLGNVPGWKACFSARYGDAIVAIIVLGRPVARMADDGAELSITRFSRREDRPDNTGSWLIAPARDWAYLEGYETLSAHSGVAGNYGDVYEAAGFLLDCPHCGWIGHSNGLLQTSVDVELTSKFDAFSIGESVDICPNCESPPVTLADGAGWQSREHRDSWDNYIRRKWVYQLRESVNEYEHEDTDPDP